MEQNSSQGKGISPRWPRLTAVVVAISVFVVLLLIVVPPHTVLGKANSVGYAVCHQIAERSFILGGRPLPLCARCTGTFLGAVLGLTVMLLRGRYRASRLPAVTVLGLLVVFIGFWAFDGLNSYMTLFPGAPHLYEPRNWLRLTTGMLNGLALIALVFPIYNFTVWREPTPEPVIRNVRELVVLLPIVALLVLVIQAEIDFLLYPLAIISSLGVVMLLVLINSMIAAVVLGREGFAASWRQVGVPLTVGAALALLQITAMVLLRGYLTSTLGISL